MTKGSFTLFCFLSEDVTLKTLLMHDLSSAGHFEAFFGAGFTLGILNAF